MGPTETLSAITWLDTADSTNQAVRERLPLLDNMSVLAAFRQTAGRGQGDHTWFATPGLNLTFSLLLRPDGLKASDSVLLSCTAALGIRDYLLGAGIDAGIKLPNDIWTGGRKICGLLIENMLEGKYVRTSIIGVGLNVNQTLWPAELPNPVSMKELTGHSYDIREELPVLYRCISARAGMLATAAGRAALKEEFDNNILHII